MGMLLRAIGILVLLVWPQQDKQQIEVVLGPECIIEMHATENTDCRGPDLKNLACKRVSLTYKPGCEHINVVPK